MKVWNVVLYVAILCLSISVLAQFVPYIFPEHAEVIQSALPSVERVSDAMQKFSASTGAIANANGDVGIILLGLGETFVNGFTFMVTFFTSTITCIPELFSFLGVPEPVTFLLGAFTAVLYVMLGIALIQLITGRTFLQVE